MVFGKVDGAFVERLRAVLDAGDLLLGDDERADYGHDETEDLVFPPDVVVRPRNTDEVSRVVRLCARLGPYGSDPFH